MESEVRSLIYDIYEAAGALRITGQAMARAEGVTLAQWTLLESVADSQSATVARVARRLGLSRQAVQKSANELVDLGHLRFFDNPDHKTSPLVELTPEGKAALQRLNRRADRGNQQRFAGLTADQVEATRRTLQEMTQAVYTHPAEPTY